MLIEIHLGSPHSPVADQAGFQFEHTVVFVVVHEKQDLGGVALPVHGHVLVFEVGDGLGTALAVGIEPAIRVQEDAGLDLAVGQEPLYIIILTEKIMHPDIIDPPHPSPRRLHTKLAVTRIQLIRKDEA